MFLKINPNKKTPTYHIIKSYLGLYTSVTSTRIFKKKIPQNLLYKMIHANFFAKYLVPKKNQNIGFQPLSR